MSALGQKQTFAAQQLMSALPPKAADMNEIQGRCHTFGSRLSQCFNILRRIFRLPKRKIMPHLGNMHVGLYLPQSQKRRRRLVHSARMQRCWLLAGEAPGRRSVVPSPPFAPTPLHPGRSALHRNEQKRSPTASRPGMDRAELRRIARLACSIAESNHREKFLPTHCGPKR